MSTSDFPRSAARVLTTLLLAGYAASPSFAAPAPKGPPPPPSKTDAAYVRAYDQCQRGPVALDDFLGSPAPEYAAIRRLLSPEVQGKWAVYQGCLTLPTHSNACQSLRGFKHASEDCQDVVAYADFVWAVFRGGDAAAACDRYATSEILKQHRDSMRNGEYKHKKTHRAKLCATLSAELKSGRLQDMCAQYLASVPAAFQKTEGVVCEQMLLPFEGMPDRCGSLRNPMRQDTCKEEAGLVLAVRSGDPQICQASPLCSALSSGKTETCAPYRAQVEKLFCQSTAEVTAKFKKVALALDAQRQKDAAKAKPVYREGQPMRTTTPNVEKTLGIKKAPKTDAQQAP